MWDLRHTETSAYVNPLVETEWRKELSPKTRQSSRFSNATYQVLESSTFESTADRKKPPSVLAAVTRAFGWPFLYMGLLKLVTELLVFAQPQLLK